MRTVLQGHEKGGLPTPPSAAATESARGGQMYPKRMIVDKEDKRWENFDCCCTWRRVRRLSLFVFPPTLSAGKSLPCPPPPPAHRRCTVRGANFHPLRALPAPHIFLVPWRRRYLEGGPWGRGCCGGRGGA